MELKLIFSSEDVVTVSGDGGFSYGLGELATFARLGLPAVHVVLNNGSLAWLAMWQRLFFDGLLVQRRIGRHRREQP